MKNTGKVIPFLKIDSEGWTRETESFAESRFNWQGSGLSQRYGVPQGCKEKYPEEEEKLPKVGLVMSMSIFSSTVLPGAGSAKTKEMMTSVWSMCSTVAFYFIPW